jgi:putative ABC transport system permease protein
VVIAVGFCGYSMLSIVVERVKLSRDSFFALTNISDVFAEVKTAPLDTVRRLEGIEGVLSAEGRLSRTVSVSGLSGVRGELKLVSIREGGMNLPLLSQGMPPRSGRHEIVIGEQFLQARNLEIGDTVGIVIDGQVVNLTITGAGITPENIYMVKNLSDMLPDFSAYDGAFLPYDTMAALLHQNGSADNFVMKLQPGVAFADIEDEINRMLEPYGIDRVYERIDQMSIAVLQGKLDGMEGMTSVLPLLFLLVAAIILYITLLRLIEQQRTQVGTMMAIGISPRMVEWHYTLYGAVIGFIGGAAGGVAGYLASNPMFLYFKEFFSLPNNSPLSPLPTIAIGCAMSTLFCGIVSWLCTHSLNGLMPAAALRPAPPKRARVSVLERIPGLVKMLTVPGMMAIRDLARNRRRAALSLLGIACAYMMTASLLSMNTIYDIFMFDPLEISQKQDITVNFVHPVSAQDAMRAVRDPSVETAEGIIEAGATLRGTDGETKTIIRGLNQGSSLLRLFDEDGLPVIVHPDGISLSHLAAGLLGVGIGDTIEVEVLFPRIQTTRVQVTGIFAEYLSSVAYMTYHGLSQVSDYRGVFSSVLLKAQPEVQTRILERLEDSTAVASIESRAERITAMRTSIGDMMGVMAMMAMMGVLIGVAVIYTSSLIIFEELKREVATLRMLGFSINQSMDVITTGQWILTAGGIMLGIPLTMGISHLLSVSFSSDIFSIPNFVNASSLVQAVGLTFLSVVFGTGMIKRKLKKLSPVELLRERE